MDGSAAALPLARLLAEAYGGLSAGDAAMYTAMSGTAGAYANLAWGSADLLLAYEPSAETLAALREQGVRLVMKPIALDALVFVVSDANGVADVTDEQLRAVYMGELTRWSALGGADIPIRAFQHDDADGSQTLFKLLLMRGEQAMEPPRLTTPGAREARGAPADYDNAEDALGFSQYYYVTRLYRAQNTRMLSVGGVAPGSETIRDGTYPYVARLYAVLREDTPPSSPARAVYDFLSTGEARRLMEGAGYIPAEQ